MPSKSLKQIKNIVFSLKSKLRSSCASGESDHLDRSFSAGTLFGCAADSSSRQSLSERRTNKRKTKPERLIDILTRENLKAREQRLAHRYDVLKDSLTRSQSPRFLFSSFFLSDRASMNEAELKPVNLELFTRRPKLLISDSYCSPQKSARLTQSTSVIKEDTSDLPQKANA